MTISDFKKSQQKLLQATRDYPKDREGEKFWGDWTIKEVVAHIAAWDEYFSKLISGQVRDYWGNIDDFNAKEVVKRKTKTLPVLIKELEESGDNFAKVFERLDKKISKRKLWPDKKYTPEDILKIQIHHYDDQLEQILKQV